ncbi:MAG: type II secretion system protein J [Burkholderiales bacterium]
MTRCASRSRQPARPASAWPCKATEFDMPRIHPDHMRRCRGVTLLEMVIAMIVVSIVVAATVFFANPVQQAIDLTARAELTDIADNTLQRMGREVRLALPNSVRTNGSVMEFIPVRTAGRYRTTSSGACGSATDELAFGTSDSCFKSVGAIPDDATVTANDFLVLNNYGTGFTDQNAYDTAPANPNRAAIVSLTGGNTVNFGATTFVASSHDSPGKRFYIVMKPVAYVCDLTAGTIKRYSGYAFTTNLDPATISGGASALIASDVTGCSFDYSATVSAGVGLLALTLTLAKATKTGNEKVTLYHSVHVNNVP